MAGGMSGTERERVMEGRVMREVCGFDVGNVRYLVDQINAVGKTYRLWRIDDVAANSPWKSVATFRRKEEAMEFLRVLETAMTTGEATIVYWKQAA